MTMDGQDKADHHDGDSRRSTKQETEELPRGFGLTRFNDNTSTEKLLKVIRSRKNETSPVSASTADPAPRKANAFKMPLPRLINLHKSSTVGIDIGHDYLRLVRTEETVGGNREVINQRRFAVPPKTPRDSPEFGAFLKSSLAAVCGPAKRPDLWVIMSAAKVDVHHVRIPKVSKKQISTVVYWTAKKETPFDEKEMVFDFETQGEVIEQGIPKLAVMVYTAPRQEIEDLKGLFSRIGWPLTGISIVPFSVQNLFRTAWIPDLDGIAASLYIGNDFSRIDIYSGNDLVMTRGIKAGLNSMVESLMEGFNETRQSPESPALTFEQARSIVRSLSPDSPKLLSTEAGADLSEEKIFQMIEPALERLARQVERTFEHYATMMPGGRIVRIYVSGAMNVYQPIIEYVGSQLGIASAVLDPLSGEASATCPDLDGGLCISERIAFAPALGLAFSDKEHTPNLMFTYKDKEREASVIRINRAVFAVFMISVLICSGIFTFQNFAIAQKKKTIAGIERQMAGLGAPIDRDQLTKMMAKITMQQQLSKVYANRYLGIVLIGELAALTPPEIRFTDLKISLGPIVAPNKEKPKGDAATQPAPQEVTIEGLITGERALLETSLAAYTMALESSPLFRQVVLQKNSVEPYLKKEALHFILNLKVEEQVHG